MILSLNCKYVNAISKADIKKRYEAKIKKLHLSLKNQTCPGKEMLGWYDYPLNNFDDLIKQMNVLKANWTKLNVSDVVIIGIGGSYTGVKAILDFVQPDSSKHLVKFHFLNSVSSSNVCKTLQHLNKVKSWAAIVISKSGTTLESAVNFRLIRQALKDRFNLEHKKRIVAITDPQTGVLHDLCVKHGYEMLPILGDIGGRFSTLTPVGLFPALLAGIEIKDLLAGAKLAHHELTKLDNLQNTAYLYAAYRHYLYTGAKKDVEIFITYEDYLEATCLQHRQLFGESEGKDHNSLFPTYSVFTTDLHSMGQLYQEGKQIFFETILKIKNPHLDLKIAKSTFSNDDHLDYLTNKSLHEINYLACAATTKAHANAGVNIIEIELTETSAVTFGYLYYWLSLATSMSALLLKHNPFNQPGVEQYKKLMFKLLGKK